MTKQKKFLDFYRALLATSNVTGRHRGPKQTLRAGYRASSLPRTSYLRLLLFCEASSIFHRPVSYLAPSLLVRASHVFNIRTSSSSPRLPMCQIPF